MRISDWSSDVCSSDLGIAEDGGPLAEREVRGDDDAGALIKLADEVEQQLPSRACERQISKLVEHDQVEPRQLRRQGPALADPGLLFKACHQIDGVEVAGASASSHDIGCDRDRSEEHTSELQSLMRISYAVFFLKNKKNEI